MGIKKNFKNFLKNKSIHSFYDIKFEDLRGKKIAIDVPSIYYKHWVVCQNKVVTAMRYGIISNEIDIDDVRGKWMNLIWISLSKLLKYGITLVMIFDGVAPLDKRETQQERIRGSSDAKTEIDKLRLELKSVDPKLISTGILDKFKKLYEKYHTVRKTDYDLLRHMFQGIGLCTLESPTEAEILCSELCKKGLVSAVYSSDSDNLAHGCPVWLHNIDHKGNQFQAINYGSILKTLNLNEKEFMDLCILIGCDYNKSINLVGPETAYNYITKFKSIDAISSQVNISTLNHVNCRNIFNDHNYVSSIGIKEETLCIDKNCINTYSQDYLSKHNMEYILPELSDIYQNGNFERNTGVGINGIDLLFIKSLGNIPTTGTGGTNLSGEFKNEVKSNKISIDNIHILNLK